MALTITDLNNGKLDLDLIAEVALSNNATATNRLGGVVQTVKGAVDSLKAFNPRGAFAGATSYAIKDVYTHSEITYVAVVAHTSSTVAADLAAGKVTIHQGLTQTDLAQPEAATLIADQNKTVHSALRDQAFAKCVEMDGSQSCAIVPRIPALGSANFTAGAVFSADSTVGGLGLFGGLSGSLQISILSTGIVKITSTSVADIGLSSTPIYFNSLSSVFYVRQSGVGSVYVDGNLAGSFADTTNYFGDIAFLGSKDGINGMFSGVVSFACVMSAALTQNDINNILYSGLSSNNRASCLYAMGTPSADMPLVVAPASNTIRSTVLPPSGASLRGVNQDGIHFGNTPRYGNAYFFGDSQTYGFNASGSSVYTDTSTTRLLSQYRWPNIYATSSNRDMVVSNLGVTGSGLRYIAGHPTTDLYAWQTQFYAMGALPYNWIGMVVLTNAWNDFPGASLLSTSRLLRIRRGIEACVAKASIDDYGGITTTGYYRDSSVTVSGWSCTGSDQTLIPPSSNCNPFIVALGGIITNDAIRKIILDPGEYIQFTILAIQDLAIFTEAHALGAPYTLSINGTVVLSDTCYTAENDYWPQVNWLENVTPGDVFRLTAGGTSGQHVIYHAAGYRVADNTTERSRSIIVASTTGNTNNHEPNNIYSVSRQAMAAAQTHADKDAYFVDISASWQTQDSDGQDPDHISPIGNYRIAKALGFATPVNKSLPMWCHRS